VLDIRTPRASKAVILEKITRIDVMK
jgi:hypothetical protein